MLITLTQKGLRLMMAGIFLLPVTASAQFTTGNVIVLQAGTGTATLTSAATPVFLKEYNTSTANQTTPVKTVLVDTSGPARLTIGGTATSEGQMTLSSDSFRLVIAGYDAAVGTASINGTSSGTVARAIDTLSNAAIPGRADTTKSVFSAASIRSATKNGGENYWADGANTGIYYMGNVASPAIVYSATTNLRVMLAQSGKLYFSTMSGIPRIGRINSQPTSGPASADTMISLGSTASPYGFAINLLETVVYVADDRTSAGGGIQKWTLSGGVWSLAYTLNTGTSSGARSVIADWSSTAPVLYVITNTGATSGGNLIRFVDSNSAAVFTILASAPANTAFRSVAFAPRPCMTPALSFTTTPRTCTAAGSVMLATTGGTGPFTFAYSGPGTFTATTQNISAPVTGTYKVTVTANGGCSKTDSAIVADSAILPPVILTYSGSLTRCQGDSILLTSIAGTGYHYQWTLNGNPLLNDTMRTYKAGASGIYNSYITYGICTRVNAGITVTINPLPSATLGASGPISFCTGGSVQLCAPSGTGYTYQFQNSSGNISGATAQCYTATASGNYKVVVNSAQGCKDSSAATTVTVGAPPSAMLTPSGTVAVCPGDSITFRTNRTPGLTYTWYRNGTVIAGATDSTFRAATPGIYRVAVSLSASCSDTSARDTLIANPAPSTLLRNLTADSICAGDTIRLRTAGGGSIYRYLLDGNVFAVSPDSNLSVNTNAGLSAARIFSFKVIVTSAAGCTDSSAARAVIVNPLPYPVITSTGAVLSTTTPFSTYQWYRNDTVIAGATNAVYTAATSATYKVRVTNASGCAATSTGLTLRDLSAGNALAAAGIRIFPNPAQETIFILSPIPVRVQLRDMQGRMVASATNAARLSIGELPGGVYSLAVFSIDGAFIGTQLVTKE